MDFCKAYGLDTTIVDGWFNFFLSKHRRGTTGLVSFLLVLNDSPEPFFWRKSGIAGDKKTN